MRYVIDGCYGDGNVGDEALLGVICALLREADRDADICALSADPAETARLHGTRSLLQTNPFGRNIYGALVKGQLAAIVRAIRRCDCFILGGGELFRDDVGLRSTLGMFYRALIARLLGKRVAAIGVGAQRPTRRVGRALLRRVLRTADRVVFRDEASLAVARDLAGDCPHFSWCPDLVFALPGPAPVPASGDAPLRVGIALKHLPGLQWQAYDQPDLVDSIVAALTAAAGRFPIRYEVIAFGGPDRAGAQQVADRLRAAGVECGYWGACDLAEIQRVIGGLDHMVSMPLHGCIVALKAGIPTLGLAYDHKVTKLFRQFGLEDYCLPCDRLDTESLLTALQNQIRGADALRQQIRETAGRAKQRVRASVRVSVGVG